MIKKITTLVLIMATFIHCKKANENKSAMKTIQNQTENGDLHNDTGTPKVTGIGGIFFYSDAPGEIKAWYTKNLGISINDWGSSSFESRDIDNPERINTLQWKPFDRDEAYFSPSKKDFMINYTVQNIEGLIDKLKNNGVTVLDTITAYDGIGKFVHILDGENNKIELWEPED